MLFFIFLFAFFFLFVLTIPKNLLEVFCLTSSPITSTINILYLNMPDIKALERRAHLHAFQYPWVLSLTLYTSDASIEARNFLPAYSYSAVMAYELWKQSNKSWYISAIKEFSFKECSAKVCSFCCPPCLYLQGGQKLY